MTEAGYGKKSNDLISSYIVGKQVKGDKMYFDIHVPGHGRTDGELYQTHMNHYFQHPNEIVPVCANQIYERRVVEREFMEHMIHIL